MASKVYVRALIFVVLLLCGCVAMLWLSALQAFRPFAAFWLTVAAGTLAVIIYTAVAVYRYRDSVQGARAQVTSTVVQRCPDFWGRDSELSDQPGGCNNVFVSDDGRYQFVIGKYPTRPQAIQTPSQDSVIDGLTASSCVNVNKDYPYEYMKNLCRTRSLPTATPENAQ